MILEKINSPINGEITVKRDLGLGTYLSIGNLTQSGGILNSIWKRTLKHLKSKIFNPKHCLIIGLGGGTVVKWLGKYYPEAKIVGVDIDSLIVELGKKYLELNEKEVQIKIKDGFDFLQKNNLQYDLIIVDTYLGDQYPLKFESDDFLKLLKKRLTKHGVVIFNRLYFAEKRKEASSFSSKLEKYFSEVDYFYPQANLMLICRA